MNAKFVIKSVTMSGTTATVTAGVSSPTGATVATVAPLLTTMKFATAVSDSNGSQTYAIFKITAVPTVKLSSVVVTAECVNSVDLSVYSLQPGSDAVLYSTNGLVDDVPSGIALGVSTVLTEWLRTSNLSESIAATLAGVSKKVDDITSIVDYVQPVNTANIPTDATADKTRMHPVTLDFTPTNDKVSLEINGVVYHEDDADNGGDFVVDRSVKTLYIDAFDDNFSFADLQRCAKQIRITCKYRKS